jgi:hypothetical protein
MERMKKWMTMAFVCFLAACSREMPMVEKQSVVAPPVPAPPALSYYEGTHAAEGIQQIRAKVGEPFRVLKIRIDDDSIMLQAQDPKKPENVDEYRLSHGVLKPSVPVRLFGQTNQETLEANLFDPADVDFTKSPTSSARQTRKSSSKAARCPVSPSTATCSTNTARSRSTSTTAARASTATSARTGKAHTRR